VAQLPGEEAYLVRGESRKGEKGKNPPAEGIVACS